jgi:hypothetical protein
VEKRPQSTRNQHFASLIEEGKEAQQRVYKELLMILEEIEPGVTNNI